MPGYKRKTPELTGVFFINLDLYQILIAWYLCPQPYVASVRQVEGRYLARTAVASFAHAQLMIPFAVVGSDGVKRAWIPDAPTMSFAVIVIAPVVEV